MTRIRTTAFGIRKKKLSEIDDIKAISQTFGEYLIAKKGCKIDFENDVVF